MDREEPVLDVLRELHQFECRFAPFGGDGHVDLHALGLPGRTLLFLRRFGHCDMTARLTARLKAGYMSANELQMGEELRPFQRLRPGMACSDPMPRLPAVALAFSDWRAASAKGLSSGGAIIVKVFVSM